MPGAFVRAIVGARMGAGRVPQHHRQGLAEEMPRPRGRRLRPRPPLKSQLPGEDRMSPRILAVLAAALSLSLASAAGAADDAKVKIGIIGSGRIGGTLGELWAK